MTSAWNGRAFGFTVDAGEAKVHTWAFKDNCDPSAIVSNTFTMEWPPKSGRRMEFPEIDRAGFFDLATGRRKINAAQVGLVDELEQLLRGPN